MEGSALPDENDFDSTMKLICDCDCETNERPEQEPADGETYYGENEQSPDTGTRHGALAEYCLGYEFRFSVLADVVDMHGCGESW